jgi:tetratricopeptide (TPR) repeat protein
MSDLDQALAHHQAGRLNEAEALYRQILQADPEQPDALHWLGVVALQRGQHEAAVGLIGQALAHRPDYVAAYNNLALALQAQGALDRAVVVHRRALSLAPEDPELHLNLGLALQAEGKFAEAIATYRQALALSPNSAEIHFQLGNTLKDHGNIDEAIAAYRQALALKPDYLEARNNLGTALEAQGKFAEAIMAYKEILEVEPTRAMVHYNLGNTLQRLNDLDAAIAAYRQVLVLKPDYAEAHNNLGIALEEEGKLDEALAAYKRALAIKPDFPEAYINLGNVLITLGQIGSAGQAYREALRHKPDLGAAYNGIVRTKKYRTKHHEDARSMLALLDAPELAEADAMHLHFALGKIFDDCGACEEALVHYREGNRIKHKTSRFDAREHTNLIERVIRTFGAEFFSQRSGYGSSSELPVFIVGMPRSGTTLVEQIIASHPQAHGAGELNALRRVTRDLGVRLTSPYSYPEVASVLDRDTSRSLAAEYEQALRQGADSAVVRITDKTPVNFTHLGLIALLFPNARVIHCLRDPLDVCVSIYFQLFRSGNDYAYDFADIAAYYRQYRRLMAHWRAVLPLRTLEIGYETLACEQERNTRRLLDFLGLPWDKRCLAFHENLRPVQTASAWQVRQPLYKSAVNRWRKYEKFLGPLQQSLELDS